MTARALCNTLLAEGVGRARPAACASRPFWLHGFAMRGEVTSFRLARQERELLEALRRRLGARSRSEVVRLALRRLAEAENEKGRSNQ